MQQCGPGQPASGYSRGCTTLQELCATTGAGTGCGSCRPEVQQLLATEIAQVVALAVPAQELITATYAAPE
ncbi:(2Fe-2S)-binding protein [Hymenobacter cellulosilyticus]|uniref:(2Fe-2S)-binding protein n=1 Tax=Hymenobacter cellulosilyticus TaxID=2932248 RepID=UPI0035CC5ED3